MKWRKERKALLISLMRTHKTPKGFHDSGCRAGYQWDKTLAAFVHVTKLQVAVRGKFISQGNKFMKELTNKVIEYDWESLWNLHQQTGHLVVAEAAAKTQESMPQDVLLVDDTDMCDACSAWEGWENSHVWASLAANSADVEETGADVHETTAEVDDALATLFVTSIDKRQF
jgi:hypothetical protein